MATLCKNCGHSLVYDPAIRKMHCTSCGSAFEAEEVESLSRSYREDENIVSLDEVYGNEKNEFLDCYVYTCSNCGGEIIINGSEASTMCIYCGSSNVVFSRVARHKRPEYILPFQITKEQALEAIHSRIDGARFIPKEIRNFEPENVRGIYIPYWIVDADHVEAAVIKGSVKSGKYSTPVHFGRTGKLDIRNLPLDASKLLSDESSARLEPFDLKQMKPFDEDYLLGFYSNVSDITYGDLRQACGVRAHEMFEHYALNSVQAGGKKIVSSRPSTLVHEDIRYAMLPCWFVTFTSDGKHNTILVNGQTGKVVCGLPWNKALFWTLTILAGILFSILATLAFYGLFSILFSSGHHRSGSSNGGKSIGAIISLIVVLFVSGTAKMRKVLKQISLTQSTSIFNFVKKRQE